MARIASVLAPCLLLLVLQLGPCTCAGSSRPQAQQPCHADWQQPVALEAPRAANAPAAASSLSAAAGRALLRLQARTHAAAITPGSTVAAAAAGATASSSSSTSTGSSSSQRGGRRLLHLEATEGIDTADVADEVAAAEWAQGLPYARDSYSVARYLSAELASGRAPIEVPVWFVVVSDPRNPSSTNLTWSQAAAQVDLLNRAFATGLPARMGVVSDDASMAAERVGARQLWRFQLLGVRYLRSSTPMCIGSHMELSTKHEWHSRLTGEAMARASGGSRDRTLIIYVSDLLSPACHGAIQGYSVLFGWSNTPIELAAWKARGMGYRDGIVIDFKYLLRPGAQIWGWPKSEHGAATGAQLVHETGHFMGLLHTFIGGCSSDPDSTDGVDDTPPEAHPRQWQGVDLGDASGGCKPRRTCPWLGGPADRIDNYMSYNNLACAASFTPGQQARMLWFWHHMRNG